MTPDVYVELEARVSRTHVLRKACVGVVMLLLATDRKLSPIRYSMIQIRKAVKGAIIDHHRLATYRASLAFNCLPLGYSSAPLLTW